MSDTTEIKLKSQMTELELLYENSPEIPEVGDVVPGTVIYVGSSSALVDLGPLGTGVVLGKEMKDGLVGGKLRVGDTVSATLTSLENEDGTIELSIREASYDKSWEDIETKLRNKDALQTKIMDARCV